MLFFLYNKSGLEKNHSFHTLHKNDESRLYAQHCLDWTGIIETQKGFEKVIKSSRRVFDAKIAHLNRGWELKKVYSKFLKLDYLKDLFTLSDSNYQS